MLEIESKFYLESEPAAREVCRLLALDWSDGTFERNHIFDFADGRLKRQGAIVRVRERDTETFLTYKEKTKEQFEGAKVRLELDTAVSSRSAILSLLEKLGLNKSFTYERYRARHARGDAHVEIDRMPGGWFCEIEGSPEAIRDARMKAGLEQATAIAWSYPEIFANLPGDTPAARDWTFEAYQRGLFVIPAKDDAFWRRAAVESDS